MRVLVVPDKFKSTLAAADVCAAIARGWKSVRPNDQLSLLPMSDGGDGFGPVMGSLLQARLRSVKTLDAAHRPVTANWWWEPREKLAVIEAARVIGLAMLPPKKFHPFQLDTFGLGRVLEAAFKAGAKHCVIGIGGSATNDAGFGLARALGWRFLDRRGRELEQWWELGGLHKVDPCSAGFPACEFWRTAGRASASSRQFRNTGLESPMNSQAGKPALRGKGPAFAALRRGKREGFITVAVDVGNPLLGARGCSRVYGPQKGLRPEDMALAEKCLRRLAVVLDNQLGITAATIPGAGAAGGLGFGLMAFAGAGVRSGFEVFAEAADLDEQIRSADLVITGEGAVDRQTLMGKGVGRVAELCAKHKVPCVALAGMVSAEAKAKKLFAGVFGLTEITTLKNALKRPGYYLERLSAEVAWEFTIYEPNLGLALRFTRCSIGVAAHRAVLRKVRPCAAVFVGVHALACYGTS